MCFGLKMIKEGLNAGTGPSEELFEVGFVFGGFIILIEVSRSHSPTHLNHSLWFSFYVVMTAVLIFFFFLG